MPQGHRVDHRWDVPPRRPPSKPIIRGLASAQIIRPILRQTHPPPELSQVAARVDHSIDDEAAGSARREYREAAEQRRAETKARIGQANRENQRRLAAIRSLADDGDGKLDDVSTPQTYGTMRRPMSASRSSPASSPRSRGSPRPSHPSGFTLAEMFAAKQKQEQAAHRTRVASARSAIDDDTEVCARTPSKGCLHATRCTGTHPPMLAQYASTGSQSAKRLSPAHSF